MRVSPPIGVGAAELHLAFDDVRREQRLELGLEVGADPHRHVVEVDEERRHWARSSAEPRRGLRPESALDGEQRGRHVTACGGWGVNSCIRYGFGARTAPSQREVGGGDPRGGVVATDKRRTPQLSTEMYAEPQRRVGETAEDDAIGYWPA